jgi:hypothetical protein
VKPVEKTDLHREIPKGLNLDGILCIKEEKERVLRNDFTISYKGKLYQITESIKAKKVTVQERINGRMLISHNGATVKFKEIVERPEKQKEPRTVKKRTTICLPADHPWRKFNINGWKKKWAKAA